MAEQAEVTEFGKNCACCKKLLKKARRYFRDGAYFCNKNCYKKRAPAAPAQAAG